MTDDIEDAKQRLLKESKREGLCPSQHMFNMGAHGTALAACGLSEGHDDPLDDENSFFSAAHVTRHTMADGATVTYRWTE